MIKTQRIGFFAALIAVIAFTGLSVDNAAAQYNEKRVERKATGFYKGRTTNGVLKNKTGNTTNYTGYPDNGYGRMRIPVKDGKLKTSLRDDELPADKNQFVGKEKKSNVRRNGKKIAVKAKGRTYDGIHDPIKGQVAGKLIKRGGKWVADVRLKGERPGYGGSTDYFTAKAKGKG